MHLEKQCTDDPKLSQDGDSMSIPSLFVLKSEKDTETCPETPHLQEHVGLFLFR